MTQPVPLPVLPIIETNTYFAVQLLQNETTHRVAELILRAARDIKVLFRRLEILDTITIGTNRYARVRTDLASPNAVLDRLLLQRSVVAPVSGSSYLVRFPDGRTGKLTSFVMHVAPRPGQSRIYRGPKIKRWEEQFPPTP